MYVCSGEADMGGVTTAFDYSANTCTGGTLLCSDTGVNPTTTDATCDDTNSTLTIPIAAATYDVVIFIEDNHDMPGTGTATQSYTVQNVAPYLDTGFGGGDGYINADAPAPAAGGSDAVSWTASLIDDNGDGDIQSTEGVFFDAALVTNTCSADENDCYINATCTLDAASTGTGKHATGSDDTRGVTCDFTVWYNANASTQWRAHVSPTDTVGPQVTGLADSGEDVTNNALLALDITEATIAYGTVEIGGTSGGQTTTVQNAGNQILDFYVDGTDMSSGGGTIAAGQQKWHHTSATFDWDTAGYALLNTSSGSSASTGCADKNEIVRNDHTTGSGSDEAVYWKIRIPSAQAAGTYSGTNTFTAATSGTCTDGPF